MTDERQDTTDVAAEASQGDASGDVENADA